MSVDVRYEIRLIEKVEEYAGTLQEPTIIVCARRAEAVDRARELATEHPQGWVEAWQIGADGGDPAIATSLIWSEHLSSHHAIGGVAWCEECRAYRPPTHACD